MKTVTVNITVPDDRFDELNRVLRTFQTTLADEISFSEAVAEFKIPRSTLTYWTHDLKLIPYSQPHPGGKKFVRRSDIRKLIEIKDAKKAAPRRRKTILDMGVR